MTIPSNVTRNSYTGTGITGPYPVTFKFFEDADLKVTVADTNGVESIKTLTTDYTVTGAGEQAGGSITFTASVANGYSIVIEPKADLTQDTDIKNEGGNLRESIEDRFDRLCRDDQVQQNLIDRAVKAQITDINVVDPVLPPREAGALIGWNDSGTGFANRAASLFSSDAAITSTGSTTARWISDRFGEVANVKDFGAVGDGVTDDSGAFQSCISFAVSSGKGVRIPDGQYLIADTISVSSNAGGTMVVYGSGNKANLVRASSLGSDPMLLFSEVDNLTIIGLSFTVEGDTPLAQTGILVECNQCNNLLVSGCWFNGYNSLSLATCFSALNTPSCNNMIIQGNYFIGIYGNACGINDGAGSGVNGARSVIDGNQIINCVDTGIGVWTNAAESVVSNNVIYTNDYNEVYTRTGIDLAGCTRCVVTGNQIVGMTYGIRVGSNLNYTNIDALIANNVIGRQQTNTAAPPCGILVYHNDNADSSSPVASVRIVENTIYQDASGYGVFITSYVTDTSKALSVRIDGNKINADNVSAYCVYFDRIIGKGRITFSPGVNDLVCLAAGHEVGGTAPALMDTTYAFTHAPITNGTPRTFTGVVPQSFNWSYFSPGFYLETIRFGAVSDGGGSGVISLKNAGGVDINTAKGIVNADANTTAKQFFVVTAANAGECHHYWNMSGASNSDEVLGITVGRVF